MTIRPYPAIALPSFKLGNARFITTEVLRAFVRDLEQESLSPADAEVA